jgi:O-antigen/teichoic acid export membrane protein
MNESDITVTEPQAIPSEPSGSGARRVALNALNPFLAQIFTKLLMMGYLIAQYRIVGGGAGGPLGDYFLAGTLYLYTSTVAEWGLGTLFTREAARTNEGPDGQSRTTYLFTQTLALRLLLSVLLFVPVGIYLLVYTNLFGLTSQGMWATLIITLSLLPAAVSGSVTAMLFAREQMTLPAMIGVGTAVLNVVLGLITLVLGWGVIGLAGAALLSGLVTALFFWGVLKREFPQMANAVTGQNLIPRQNELMRLLGAGFPLMLNALLVGLFFRADVFIVRASQGGVAVEQYNAAYSFLSFVLLITPAVTLALFPRMSRYAETDRPRLLLEYRFALKLLLLLSVPIVGMTVWFAPLLITILTGGKEGYLPQSAVALQILIFFLPLSFANGLTQYVLIALDKQKLLTGAFAATVLFNLAANLMLVPVAGIYGAAFATVASEVVLLGPFLFWVRREIGPAELPRVGISALFAGLLVMGALWLMAGLMEGWNRGLGGFALYMGGGVLLLALYGLALYLLSPFSARESEALRRVLRRG